MYLRMATLICDVKSLAIKIKSIVTSSNYTYGKHFSGF